MSQRVKTIVISGGIGSGKSVVSNVLRALGYTVYDCDSEAKRIMDDSHIVKERLSYEIDRRIVRNNQIDRKLLAEIVFNDSAKLEILNSIVHGAVKADLIDRIEKFKQQSPSSKSVFFIETAILYQSGLDSLADIVWEVSAPVEIRINRVMKRNGLNRKEVVARIESQMTPLKNTRQQLPTMQIINDNICALLPQIERLLKSIS